jgi:hypothetical protein
VSSVQAQCNILCYEEPKCVAFNFRTRTNVENCQLTHVTKTKNKYIGENGDWTLFHDVEAVCHFCEL